MAKIFLLANQLVVVASLVCYMSVFVPPNTLWLAGFLNFSVPVLLLCNVAFALGWLLLRRYRFALYSLAVLLLGFYYLRLSFQWNLADEAPPQFGVLSYNTHIFNCYGPDPHGPKNRAMVDWVANDDADIKCFQEFYNLDSSRVFNTTQRLKRRGYHAHVKQASTNDYHGQIGMAIFSRYPIVRKGLIDLKGKIAYGAIFADVKIGADTLRVINVHLQSMSIDENELLNPDQAPAKLKRVSFDVFKRLKHGFQARNRQSLIVLEYVAKSPYPVVLCGDLNELPYSHAYYLFKKQLNNAFEEAGKGFGFTYNGRLFFLRIDNQFYSPQLRLHHFHTLRAVPYSDHFPVKAGYSMP